MMDLSTFFLDCPAAASGSGGLPSLRATCPPEPWRRLGAWRGNLGIVRVPSSLRAQRGNPVFSVGLTIRIKQLYYYNIRLDCFVVSLLAKTSRCFMSYGRQAGRWLNCCVVTILAKTRGIQYGMG